MLGRAKIRPGVATADLPQGIIDVAVKVHAISKAVHDLDIGGSSMTPPPQDTKRLLSRESDSSARVSSANSFSPNVSKILVTLMRILRSTMRSVSTNLRLNIPPRLRARVDLPAPRKPIKKTWSHPRFSTLVIVGHRPLPRMEGREAHGARKSGTRGCTTYQHASAV